jgi:nucleotide-binding universal stress UspA family protein
METTSETDLDNNGTLDADTLRRISPLLASTARPPKVVSVSATPSASAAPGTLAAEAASGKYDLVVIGTENRAIQHRLFFGADTERLIRNAPVAIALVVPNIGRLETM